MTIELKDTVEMMNSKDFKERFCAEYFQTKIRYEKLRALLRKWDAQDALYDDDKTTRDFLGFKPTCPNFLLERQLSQMGGLLKTYEIRAVIEGIDLHEYECRLVNGPSVLDMVINKMNTKNQSEIDKVIEDVQKQESVVKAMHQMDLVNHQRHE